MVILSCILLISAPFTETDGEQTRCLLAAIAAGILACASMLNDGLNKLLNK